MPSKSKEDLIPFERLQSHLDGGCQTDKLSGNWVDHLSNQSGAGMCNVDMVLIGSAALYNGADSSYSGYRDFSK